MDLEANSSAHNSKSFSYFLTNVAFASYQSNKRFPWTLGRAMCYIILGVIHTRTVLVESLVGYKCVSEDPLETSYFCIGGFDYEEGKVVGNRSHGM